jgi:hypothetical protein
MAISSEKDPEQDPAQDQEQDRNRIRFQTSWSGFDLEGYHNVIIT